jgi:hypothetical protein
MGEQLMYLLSRLPSVLSKRTIHHDLVIRGHGLDLEAQVHY